MTQPAELTDVIAKLRTDLEEALDRGRSSPLTFELGKVTLELGITVEKTGTASGSVKLWVVNLGADGSASADASQKLTLELTPRWRGRPGERVEIAGQEQLGER